ncbi:AI-2E family transporter, partial [Patescibacteria group bacterium]|nr:AI-2E family transporter [Patescibacteria group bacterium]
LVVLGSGLMLPPLVEQVQQLGEILPGYLQDLSREFEGRSGLTVAQGLDQASTYISSFADRFDEALVSVYEAVYSLFGGLFSFILVFVLSFYFLIEENGFKKFIKSFVPQRQKSYVMGLVGRIQIQMGRWLRGQLFLGLVIGIVTYIVLSLLGVRYALVLAILAGLLEIVPYIGPVISAVPAILLALLQSPLTALFVLIAYIIIQQLENHFLVPKIMSKAVGLNPLVIILVILAGAKIAGIGGAIVAVPAATALSVILGDVFEDRGRAEEKKKGQGGKASQKKTGAWTSLRNAFKLK